MNKKNILVVKFMFAISIFFVSSLLLTYIYILFQIQKEKPTDIVVTNIGTTDATIYWKNNEGVYSILSYKEKDKNTPYIPVIGSSLYKNIKEENYFYEATLSRLQPNTTYTFRIQSPKNKWDFALEFTTDEYGTKVELPEIKTGDTERGNFLLIDNEGKKNMVYTSYHGTWALDLKGDYTVSEYGQYIPSEMLIDELKSSLSRISSPIYAESGPNCKTNITINNNQYLPTDKQIQRVIDIGYFTCKGDHTDECYKDVYCQSIEAGVNPALPLTLWFAESGVSMYARWPDVEDFGIHGGGVPSRDFTKQLERLLDVQMADDYISGYCTDKGLTEEERWATKYSKGYCTDENIAGGKAYITKIRTYYNLLTNGTLPSWPWNVTQSSSACDRTKEVTNSVYRDCNGNPSGTNPEPPEDENYCWYIDPNKNNICVKTTIKYESCAKEGMFISEAKCKTDPLCFIKDTKCASTRSVQTCDAYHLEKKAFSDNKCTVLWKSNSDPDPDPNPTPEPGINCSGSDIIPGKADILVGETCKDVGGCECFKGTIKSENYLKDVKCGYKCTEQQPNPDPNPNPDPDPNPVPTPEPKDGVRDEMIVTTKDRDCIDLDGCVCLYDKVGNNYSTRINANFGYTCTPDKKVIKTESTCCYYNKSLSMKMPYDCSGVIRSDINKENCKIESTEYVIREGISFINPLEIIDVDNPLIPKSAYDLINISDKRIIAVGEFKSGVWVKVVKYENGKINGTDFALDSGKSYMISALHDTKFTIKGYRLTPSDVLKSLGWTLVPSSVFSNKGTTSVDILENLEFNQLKQIAQWQEEKGLFQYTFKDETNNIFGDELNIKDEEGIFVKVLEKN